MYCLLFTPLIVYQLQLLNNLFCNLVCKKTLACVLERLEVFCLCVWALHVSYLRIWALEVFCYVLEHLEVSCLYAWALEVSCLYTWVLEVYCLYAWVFVIRLSYSENPLKVQGDWVISYMWEESGYIVCVSISLTL